MTGDDGQVSGWRPDFGSADEVIAGNSDHLQALVGHRLVGVWTVCSVDGDWFADLPVVWRFDDGTQLEVCWAKLDDLSLSWGTIDLTVTPRAWVDWPLEWRRDADATVKEVVGGSVSGVRATSFLFETKVIDERETQRSSWMTTGLWLVTDRGDIHVFNALDENGMSGARPERDATHEWRSIGSLTDGGTVATDRSD